MTNDYGNLELHQVLLSAMKDIDKICRENGLKYFLHAGTLLGAMNYQGFIPWDDDVDISLLREDYNVLLNVLQRDYSDIYFLQNYETDSTFTNNRAVVRVLGTKIQYNHGNAVHNEIGVDIVPLDSAPNSRIARKLQQTIIWIFDAAVQIKQGRIIPRHPFMKCIGFLGKADRKKLGRMIDRFSTFFNGKKTEYIGLLTYTGKSPYTGRSGYENDLMKREWYDKPLEVPFEDTFFMTISDPAADLIHRYGANWAAPYPEEKRVTKHDVRSYEISEEVRKRIRADNKK